MSGKILIVDDVATNRIVMKVKLAAAGYTPVMANDAASCLAIAAREKPDLILLDLMLPDMSGLAVLARLRADPVSRGVPVLMFSASQDPAARVQAFAAGADEFLQKPIDDQTLLARIRSFMRARSVLDGFSSQPGGMAMLGLAEAVEPFRPPGVVALIMGRADLGLTLRRDLAGYLPDHVITMTADDAMADAATAEDVPSGVLPDVYLINSDHAGPGSGLRLMSELRSRRHSRHALISVISASGSANDAEVAFDLGANDLVTAQIAPQELALRLARLLARKREADAMRASVQDGLRLAMIDPLTGLHNRRYCTAQLGAIAAASRHSGLGFAVLVVDLDRFKSVNDRWGHAAGDAVLMDVASRLSRNVRVGDLVARIGGEEFLIALPETGLAEARDIAQRLCLAVETPPVRLPDQSQLHVTVSIGMSISSDCELRDGNDGIADVIERADRALLNAKAAGRNRVTVHKTATAA